MSQFREYLWKLLPRIYKQTPEPDTQKWVNALGDIADAVKQSIFRIRRAWIIATATGEALDAHGEKHQILRKTGESDDDYRPRVQGAFRIYREGGTNEGIKKALASLGHTTTEVYEIIKERARHDSLRRYDGTAKYIGENCKWAEFKVIFRCLVDKEFTTAELVAIIDAIFKKKSAHAMPVLLDIQFSDIKYRHNGRYQYKRRHQYRPQSLGIRPAYETVNGRVVMDINLD